MRRHTHWARRRTRGLDGRPGKPPPNIGRSLAQRRGGGPVRRPPPTRQPGGPRPGGCGAQVSLRRLVRSCSDPHTRAPRPPPPPPPTNIIIIISMRLIRRYWSDLIDYTIYFKMTRLVPAAERDAEHLFRAPCHGSPQPPGQPAPACPQLLGSAHTRPLPLSRRWTL